MRTGGIIHPELARVLAELGHGHRICVADAGLPIPDGVTRIDLAYRLGAPTFADVIEAIGPELVVERITTAEEAASHCPDLVALLTTTFPDAEPRSVSHQQLKSETETVRAVIRTGETTPYANAILHSGVPF